MQRSPSVEPDVRERLLEWFEREKRALPWRATRDPYAIWISEAMLQQTRVETVIPYWRRFLARFPTVRDLAAAAPEDVLASWSGLGYYRRARSLHEAARAIVARHHGDFPRSVAELRELPGIGPYTAGAVASIAFGEPAALVDGNVARVLARWFALDAPQESRGFRASTWERARELVAGVARPGAWNQALMELGAVVCTPRDPACERCPLARECRARSSDRVAELPRPKVRPTPIAVTLLVLVVRERGRVLVRERPGGGRMAGLIELPTIETSGGEHVAARSFSPLVLAELEELGNLAHAITRHRIRARVATGRLARGRVASPWRWISPEAIVAQASTGMTRKILARGWLDRR